MDDSPWILRIVLLLIGAVVVAAIYIFNVVRHRRRNRSYE